MVRNLIIGAASGYNWDQLRAFILSARHHHPDDRVVLLTGEIDQATRERCLLHGTELVDLPSSGRRHLSRVAWFFVRALLKWQGPASRSPLQRWALPVYVMRLAGVSDYLARHCSPETKVFHTDTRDVFFQRNIFDDLLDLADSSFEKGEMHCFSEPVNQEDSFHNTRWLKKIGGDDLAARLASKPIICSGTTLFHAALYPDYIAQFWSVLCRGGRTIDGIDQGIHNVLLYENDPPWVRTFDNAISRSVLTAGFLDDVSRNDDGLVVNESGQPYAALHQYDRLPAMVEQVNPLVDQLEADAGR